MSKCKLCSKQSAKIETCNACLEAGCENCVKQCIKCCFDFCLKCEDDSEEHACKKEQKEQILECACGHHISSEEAYQCLCKEVAHLVCQNCEKKCEVCWKSFACDTDLIVINKPYKEAFVSCSDCFMQHN